MNPSLIPVVDVVAKGIAVLLLAMGILSLWRGASAAQRSLVWLLCFGTLLWLPVTLLVQPWWKVPVSEVHTVVQLPATPKSVVTTATAAGESVAFVETVREENLVMPRTVTQVLAMVWGLGVAGVLAWRFMGSIRLRVLSNRTQRCDEPAVRRVFARVSAEVPLRRPVSLRTSAEVSVPMTWGSVRPVLLLPEEAKSWSDEELHAAMLHEMGHIKHWDHFGRLMMSVVCAVYWFNPLVWLGARRWRTAQEQASDDMVVAREGHRAESYAMQLLYAARHTRQEGLLKMPVMTMAQPSTLEQRLSAIMDEGANRRPVHRAMFALGTGGVLGLLTLCAGLQLRAAESPTPPKSVHITCRIIECTSDEAKKKLTDLPLENGRLPQYSPAQLELLTKALNSLKGVNVLSAPSLITKSGTNAVISMERSDTYALDGAGKKSMNVTSGITVDILPTVEGDNITLEIVPSIKVLDGVIEKNGTPKPEMAELKMNTKATIKAGDTVVIDGSELKVSGPNSQLVFLVTASVDAAPESAAPEASEGAVATPADSAASSSSEMLKRAESIIIPTVDFRDATLKEAVEFFQLKSRTHDSGGKGVNIVLSSDAQNNGVRLTLNLKDVPLSEALRYTAELSGLELTADELTLFLKKKANSSSPKQDVRVPTPAPAKSAALERAKKIILPKVKFSYATLSEAVEFLNIKGRELDAEKQGVNVFVVPASSAASGKSGRTSLPATISYGEPSQSSKKADPEKPSATVNLAPEGAGQSTRVTLDLIDVPLSEAVVYVAELAGMEVVAEQSALYLRPKSTQK